MGKYAKRPLPSLTTLGTIDQSFINYLVSLIPSTYTHPATHPASMIEESSARVFVSVLEKGMIHESGSDNQDLSGLVAKETGKSLVSDTLISQIHAAGSDNQDLSVKQDVLVSGTNIKTINNTSILGSGNISIEGSGGLTQSQILTRQL